MQKFIVTATALTVREGPGTSFKALGYLKESDIVEVIGINEDDSWKKIQAPSGLIGWSSSQYLSAVTSDPLQPDLLPMGAYAVNSIGLFMRQGPTRDYRVVNFLKQNDIVESLGHSLDGTWLRIRNKNEVSGWGLSKYFKRVDPPGANDIGIHRLSKYQVNIYQNPGQDLAVIGQVKAEYLVNVTAISADKLWKRITTNLGMTGWCLSNLLVSLGESGKTLVNEEFPWMPIAFGELGTREYPGSKHNSRVQEYLASTSLGEGPILPDETHWCAAFVNWCVERAGIQSNNSPMAVAWSRWGQSIGTPRRGCIVTFKWDDGGSHVAFYLGEDGDKVYALGGNQSDGVWVMSYPRKNVTAYRIQTG